MAVDMNSMAAGYSGYGGQQPTASGGPMPAAPTAPQGVSNMIQALIKGYQGNKSLQGGGMQPLTDQGGMGIPNPTTSQASMGGGTGGGVFPMSPTGDPGPVQQPYMAPQNPYSDQTIGGLFGGGGGMDVPTW